MVILNFAHPLTDDHLARIEALSGQSVERVVNTAPHFDNDRPFDEQIEALVEKLNLTSRQWQTLPLLINPPSLNIIAVILMAELHGRCGYFPTILRLRPIASTTPPRFEVAELINLQAVRERARKRRDDEASA